MATQEKGGFTRVGDVAAQLEVVKAAMAANPEAAAAIHAIGSKLREHFVTRGAFGPEVAMLFEQLAEVAAAVANGTAVPHPGLK